MNMNSHLNSQLPGTSLISFIFQHPKYTSKSLKTYLDRKHIIEHYHSWIGLPDSSVGSSREITELKAVNIQRMVLNVI